MGMERAINDNDNDRFLKESSMTMKRGKRKLCEDTEAEEGAERLAHKLDAPECREFFLKVMYHLPYTEREKILSYSLRSGIASPKKYFTHSARKALAKHGY